MRLLLSKELQWPKDPIYCGKHPLTKLRELTKAHHIEASIHSPHSSAKHSKETSSLQKFRHKTLTAMLLFLTLFNHLLLQHYIGFQNTRLTHLTQTGRALQKRHQWLTKRQEEAETHAVSQKLSHKIATTLPIALEKIEKTDTHLGFYGYVTLPNRSEIRSQLTQLDQQTPGALQVTPLPLSKDITYYEIIFPKPRA